MVRTKRKASADSGVDKRIARRKEAKRVLTSQPDLERGYINEEDTSTALSGGTLGNAYGTNRVVLDARQEPANSGVCFWQLPRELRDPIYAYAFGGSCVHPWTSGSRKDPITGQTLGSRWMFTVCQNEHPSDVYAWSRQGADPGSEHTYGHPSLQGSDYAGICTCPPRKGERWYIPAASRNFLNEAQEEAYRSITIIFNRTSHAHSFFADHQYTRPRMIRNLAFSWPKGLDSMTLDWQHAINVVTMRRLTQIEVIYLQVNHSRYWSIPDHKTLLAHGESRTKRHWVVLHMHTIGVDKLIEAFSETRIGGTEGLRTFSRSPGSHGTVRACLLFDDYMRGTVANGGRLGKLSKRQSEREKIAQEDREKSGTWFMGAR